MANLKLFPWTRRQMMRRADKGEGSKTLSHEYGIELQYFNKVRRKWREFLELEDFFGDLLKGSKE